MDFLSFLPDVMNKIWLYGILVVLVLTFVIFIHEMGHYLVARWLGVRAEVFSIGFGREIWGRTDKRGTRWKLSLYPFGGYVRMFGERDTPELLTEPPDVLAHAFFNKPLLHRAAIVAAGPAINILFGLTLLTVVYMTLGRPAPEPYIAALEIDGPAYKAGLKIGDVYKTIDGQVVLGIEDARRIIGKRSGETVIVEAMRGSKKIVVSAIPKKIEEKNSYGFPTYRGTLGSVYPVYGFDIHYIYSVNGVDTRDKPELAHRLLKDNLDKDVIIDFGKPKAMHLVVHPPARLNSAMSDKNHKDYMSLTLGPRPNETMKRMRLPAALATASDLTWQAVNQTLGVVFQIFAGTKKTTELGGVVKISTMTGNMAGKGAFIFLSFIALLSVNIGLANLFPIPMLDGGHLLFIGLEALNGKPVSLTTKGYIYGFGLIFLLLAVFVINVNDVIGLLKK